MEMLELRMTTDLETALPAEIGFNFEELETELKQRLEHYNQMVVTEDAVKEAKEDLANLRKLREALETKRKDVKKQCEGPYKAFEAKEKRLIALIDAPISAINGQVKKFEDQEREKKQGEVEAAYDELVPEALREIIPLNRILDPKWLNKTTTMKSIRERIAEIVKRANVDMALIEGTNPKYTAAVRAKYIETLDVSTALDYQDELAAAEERFRQQEEAIAKRNAEKRGRDQYEFRPETKPPVAVQEPVRQAAPQPTNGEKLYTLHLEFKLTKLQADLLKKFLTDSGIKYINMDK